ncbi:MAG: hypothetical protein K8R57_10960 [Verrucomicrobia bacterium]|nr:hypothetical protein [Verrucomicrobiota bacterium]
MEKSPRLFFTKLFGFWLFSMGKREDREKNMELRNSGCNGCEATARQAKETHEEICRLEQSDAE